VEDMCYERRRAEAFVCFITVCVSFSGIHEPNTVCDTRGDGGRLWARSERRELVERIGISERGRARAQREQGGRKLGVAT
jgi:hypothetical protein